MKRGFNTPPTLEALLEKARADVFKVLTEKLKAGSYYPSKEKCVAENVAIVPELGDAGVFSTATELIDDPQLIHGSRCLPEHDISTEFWFTPSGFEVQHFSWDANGDPYPTDQRQPIHPEELLMLYSLLVPVSS